MLKDALDSRGLLDENWRDHLFRIQLKGGQLLASPDVQRAHTLGEVVDLIVKRGSLAHYWLDAEGCFQVEIALEVLAFGTWSILDRFVWSESGLT